MGIHPTQGCEPHVRAMYGKGHGLSALLHLKTREHVSIVKCMVGYEVLPL